MITSTFSHINGVGKKTENELWTSGVSNWSKFFELKNLLSFPPKKINSIDENISESIEQLANFNSKYFYCNLPVNHHWRLFSEFKSQIAYIDIETTGLFIDFSSITTIALYDGKSIRCYVKGQNLEDFLDDLKQYKLIITYNGKCFDIPFLEKLFKTKIDLPHIDLRYLLKSLNYTGGLKSCEKQLGIHRGELEDVDGFFAVKFWEEYYTNKNIRALETLLAYNIEDVLNLELLMTMAYNMKLKDTPFFSTLKLQMPMQPEIPYNIDTEIIKVIKDKIFNHLHPNVY